MLWILSLLLLSPAHASLYHRDELKLRICEEIHAYMRDLPVETCFRGRFKFAARSQEALDFRWRLPKRLVCTGTIYSDNGDIQIDGCYR
jgi:hypothetical protein